MDTLTDVLQGLRLESSFYARSELRGPWGLSFSVEDGPSFHVIVTGQCWLRMDFLPRILLLHRSVGPLSVIFRYRLESFGVARTRIRARHQ